MDDKQKSQAGTKSIRVLVARFTATETGEKKNTKIRIHVCSNSKRQSQTEAPGKVLEMNSNQVVLFIFRIKNRVLKFIGRFRLSSSIYFLPFFIRFMFISSDAFKIGLRAEREGWDEKSCFKFFYVPLRVSATATRVERQCEHEQKQHEKLVAYKAC